jgi:hypothetical protein
MHKFGGVNSGGVPPDPIPNSEVKPAHGETSTEVARRKASSMPPFKSKGPDRRNSIGAFAFADRLLRERDESRDQREKGDD